MPYYRNKLYVAFDGDEDMHWYRLLQAWRDNENIDFAFYDAHDLNIARDSSLPESIKVQLRERMRNSRAMLLLVGERTKYIRGYIPWEIEFARYIDLPIIVANLNDMRRYDSSRWDVVYEYGQLRPVAVPLVGSELARIDNLDRESLLKMMLLSFIACSREKVISRELVVLIHPRDHDKINMLEVEAFLRTL